MDFAVGDKSVSPATVAVAWWAIEWRCETLRSAGSAQPGDQWAVENTDGEQPESVWFDSGIQCKTYTSDAENTDE